MIDRPVEIDLRELELSTFDGPLNVFIELHGVASGNNTATKTKNEYIELHPPPPDPPPPPPPPQPAPTGTPVSAGRAIPFDPKKFVIDREIRDRLTVVRHPPQTA